MITLKKMPKMVMEIIDGLADGSLIEIIKKDITKQLVSNTHCIKTAMWYCLNSGIVYKVPVFKDMRSISYRLATEHEINLSFANGQLGVDLFNKIILIIQQNDSDHVLGCNLPEWKCSRCNNKMKQLHSVQQN